MTKSVTIEGMSCSHCTGRVQKALSELDHVTKVEVSLEKGCATVECDAPITDQTIRDTVYDAGYDVTSIE